MAEAAYKSITPGSVVTITKVKRGKVFQQAPLLYDLTALQKDCNIHYDLPVDKTLAITQSLYEKNWFHIRGQAAGIFRRMSWRTFRYCWKR